MSHSSTDKYYWVMAFGDFQRGLNLRIYIFKGQCELWHSLFTFAMAPSLLNMVNIFQE